MAHGGFKISPDPLLIDKIRDVIGLYLAPPANAAVFAVDEKPQIQALERTAPVLPMVPGTPERRSFDYVRHGTIDLFAALNTATGAGQRADRPCAVQAQRNRVYLVTAVLPTPRPAGAPWSAGAGAGARSRVESRGC